MIRYVLSRRWLAWHLLWAVAVVVCLRLGIWQWDVAGRPHPPGAPVEVWRNYAYAVNWLIFAGVGAWFWWRFMRDQRATELAQAADPDAAVEAADHVTGTQVIDGQVRFDPFAPAAEVSAEVSPPAEAARSERTADG